MGNKTNKQTNSYGFPKPIGGIQKKAYGGVKSSRVGKKAKEMVKKNLSLFLKGINLQQMIKYNTTNDTSSSSSSSFSLFNKNNSSTNFFKNFNTKNNQNKLAANEVDDEQSHQAVTTSVNQEFALHASPSWQYVASTIGEPRFPHVDALPRTWKESLTLDQKNSFSCNAKQMKYQELLYEIILTEQSYVDDLILVYKIFIKESLRWDGLPSAVRHLFENIFQIIRLHMQLLRELRAKQLSQFPVVSSITDICRSFVSRFDVYSAYFSNFEKANNIIAESIRIQDEFGSFISRRSLWNECRNLPFTAYLLTPIQRVMKYPLFFRSLSECLLETDGDLENIECFLMEMEVVLRYFEKQKKESEDFIKLEDLGSRISGLEGSTIRIAEYGRRLIYEGYLTIIPGTQQNMSTRFDNSSNVSFSSEMHPPPLSRRNSSFSLSSSRKQKQTYVFLFNDMIVCTRERNKKRFNPTDNSRLMTPPARKGSYYGPSVDSLFKITHTPGKITLVDRAVMRPAANSEILSRRGSALFQSLRKYGSRNQEETRNSTSSDHFSFSTPYYSEKKSQSQTQKQQQSITYEKHPLQFICSIATRNLTNLQFETETPEEKDIWCTYLESILGEHVKRNVQQQQQQQQKQNYTSTDKDFNTGTAYQRATLSPTQSSYSFESNSSNESLAFSSAAWNGYCDIEKMDIDDDSQQMQQQQQQKMAMNPPLIIDKSEDIMTSIMDEFGDTIWSIGAPAGLSPYQLRKTFSNLGSE